MEQMSWDEVRGTLHSISNQANVLVMLRDVFDQAVEARDFLATQKSQLDAIMEMQTEARGAIAEARADLRATEEQINLEMQELLRVQDAKLVAQAEVEQEKALLIADMKAQVEAECAAHEIKLRENMKSLDSQIVVKQNDLALVRDDVSVLQAEEETLRQTLRGLHAQIEAIRKMVGGG